MTAIPLDPELDAVRDLIVIPDISADNLEDVRAMEFVEPAVLSGAVERVEHVVSADPPVSVRVHTPRDLERPAACLYSIHGGGYVLGSAESDDAFFDRWCPSLGVVGVSVEYRLAPETPFPGPLEDCYAALKWVHGHAADLGIDPDRIGIMGASAGGGLCAGLALLARDRAEVPVRFQLLDSPMLDDRQVTVSSTADDLIVWSPASNEFGWRSYLGELYGTDAVPGIAAPARADDLAGLPEAFVSVGGADGFRDEDIAYARRLGEAGVPTELHVYAGAPHGVAAFTGTAIAERYVADQIAWLTRQFDRLG